MPVFTFESPSGAKYRIEGPKGSTKEQAAAELQRRIDSGELAQERVGTERGRDTNTGSAEYTPPKPVKKSTAETIGKYGADILLGLPGSAAKAVGEVIVSNVAPLAGTVLGIEHDITQRTNTPGRRQPATMAKSPMQVRQEIIDAAAPKTKTAKAVNQALSTIFYPVGKAVEYTTDMAKGAGVPDIYATAAGDVVGAYTGTKYAQGLGKVANAAVDAAPAVLNKIKTPRQAAPSVPGEFIDERTVGGKALDSVGEFIYNTIGKASTPSGNRRGRVESRIRDVNNIANENTSANTLGIGAAIAGEPLVGAGLWASKKLYERGGRVVEAKLARVEEAAAVQRKADMEFKAAEEKAANMRRYEEKQKAAAEKRRMMDEAFGANTVKFDDLSNSEILAAEAEHSRIQEEQVLRNQQQEDLINYQNNYENNLTSGERADKIRKDIIKDADVTGLIEEQVLRNQKQEDSLNRKEADIAKLNELRPAVTGSQIKADIQKSSNVSSGAESKPINIKPVIEDIDLSTNDFNLPMSFRDPGKSYEEYIAQASDIRKQDYPILNEKQFKSEQKQYELSDNNDHLVFIKQPYQEGTGGYFARLLNSNDLKNLSLSEIQEIIKNFRTASAEIKKDQFKSFSMNQIRREADKAAKTGASEEQQNAIWATMNKSALPGGKARALAIIAENIKRLKNIESEKIPKTSIKNDLAQAKTAQIQEAISKAIDAKQKQNGREPTTLELVRIKRDVKKRFE